MTALHAVRVLTSARWAQSMKVLSTIPSILRYAQSAVPVRMFVRPVQSAFKKKVHFLTKNV
jgi:hypothetical protein